VRGGGGSPPRTKPPFPLNFILNIRVFYLFFIVLMIAGLAAGTLGTFGSGGGGGGDRLKPPSEETPSPEASPVNVTKYDAEPELSLDLSKQYFAVIETPKGSIRVELFDDDAPRAVNSFVFLARDGFYDGLTFYVVRPDQGFALAGDPTCDAKGEFSCRGSTGPGYTLPVEGNGRSHIEGTLALGADPSGEVSRSQFYALTSDARQQDGRDTVFGRIVEGLEVLAQLSQRNPCFEPPGPDNPCEEDPPPGDEIISVTIEEA
jgi:cyclophilin family peptidyl-prolyl cis-trans isomerase